LLLDHGPGLRAEDIAAAAQILATGLALLNQPRPPLGAQAGDVDERVASRPAAIRIIVIALAEPARAGPWTAAESKAARSRRYVL
jgi:hypothetical protein